MHPMALWLVLGGLIIGAPVAKAEHLGSDAADLSCKDRAAWWLDQAEQVSPSEAAEAARVASAYLEAHAAGVDCTELHGDFSRTLDERETPSIGVGALLAVLAAVGLFVARRH